MVTKSLFVTVTAVIFHSSYAWQEKRLLNTTHVSQAEDSGEKTGYKYNTSYLSGPFKGGLNYQSVGPCSSTRPAWLAIKLSRMSLSTF